MDSWIKSLADMYDGWGIALYALVVLLATSILCGAIGLERERHGYAAGLRTHILVGMGSCVFTLVSMFAFGDGANPADPARVAAQVVPGIGFIGAGAIIQNGVSIKGLTTAATLWVSAAIGMCSGGGLVMVAIIATAIALLVLIGLKLLESWSMGKKLLRIAYIVPLGTMSLSKVTQALDGLNAVIKDIDITTDRHEGEKCTKVILFLQLSEKRRLAEIMDAITDAVSPLAMEQLG